MYLIIEPNFAPIITNTFIESNWYYDMIVVDIVDQYWFDGGGWIKIENFKSFKSFKSLLS